MKRIFMYATHKSLVAYESSLFKQLGYEVFNTNLRPCPNIGPAKTEVLSKINYNVNFNGKLAPKCLDIMLENFDVLYVSQIPGWLMSCAPEFLKHGKKVVFRVWGGRWAPPSNTPNSSWSHARPTGDLFRKAKHSKSKILELNQHENFHIVPVWHKDGLLWDEGLRSAISYIDPNVLNPNQKRPTWRPFAAITQPDWKLYFPNLVKVKHCKIKRSELPPKEYLNFLLDSSLYCDTLRHDNVIRFVPFEAMLLGLPVIAYDKTALSQMMARDGFTSNLDWQYSNPQEFMRLVKHYTTSEEGKALGNQQKAYAEKKGKETASLWKSILC